MSSFYSDTHDRQRASGRYSRTYTEAIPSVLSSEPAPRPLSAMTVLTEAKVPKIIRNDSESVKPHSLKERTRQRRSERAVQAFYEKQKTLAEHYADDADPERASRGPAPIPRRERLKIDIAIYWTIIMSFVMCLAQAVATILTRNSIFAIGALDAFIDLLGSLLTCVIAFMAKRPRCQEYPIGRAKAEPVGLLMFGCVSINAGLILIIVASRKMAERKMPAQYMPPECPPPQFTPSPDRVIWPLVLVAYSTVIETLLAVYLYVNRHIHMLGALYLNTRNDLVLAYFSVLMLALQYAKKSPWWLDSAGGICIGVFMIGCWVYNAPRLAKKLIGRTADGTLMSRVIHLVLQHSNEIRAIQSIRGYHVGVTVDIEVCVIVDQDTPLPHACIIGLELERKIERLEEIDRAHVTITPSSTMTRANVGGPRGRTREESLAALDSPAKFLRTAWQSLSDHGRSIRSKRTVAMDSIKEISA